MTSKNKNRGTQPTEIGADNLEIQLMRRNGKFGLVIFFAVILGCTTALCPRLSLISLGIVGLMTCIWWLIKEGINLLIAIIIFSFAIPKSGIFYHSLPISPIYFLTAIGLAMTLLRSKQSQYERTGRLKLLIGLYVTYLTADFIVIYTRLGFKQYLNTAVPELVPLLVMVALVPIFTNLAGGASIRPILKLLVLVALVVSGFGLLQDVIGASRTIIPGITVTYSGSGENTLSNFYAVRDNLWNGYSKIVSTYQNGNELGDFLAPLLGMLLCTINFSVMTRKWRCLCFAAIIMTVVCLPLTLSKTAFLGLAFAFFAFTVLFKRGRIRFVTFPMPLVAGIMIIKPYLFTRLFAQLYSSSLDGRISAMRYIIAFPFSSASNGIGSMLFGESPGIPATTESLYFTIYSWLGLCGLILFLFVVLRSLSIMRKAVKRCGTSAKGDALSLASGAFMAIITYLFQSIGDGAIYLPPAGANLWIWVGLGLAASNVIMTRSDEQNANLHADEVVLT
ncbi:MAG: O-antigen ligase family protein [Alicyclobacillus sp.]|nr:O-antigen ligase family protein [Alicyclobacillus sp.]